MPKWRTKTSRVRTPGENIIESMAAVRAEIDTFKQLMLDLFDRRLGREIPSEGAVTPPPLQQASRSEALPPSHTMKRKGSDLDLVADESSLSFPPLIGSHASKKLAIATFTTTPISLSNSFENLNHEEMLSDPVSDEIATISETARIPAQAVVIAPKIAAPKRSPPIILHDVPSNAVKATSQAIMTATNGKAELRCRGTNISVFTEGNDQWKAVKELATSHQLQYHTYTPKEDRRQAWVMRGAHCETSPEEIQQELFEKFTINASVSAMTRRTREDGVLKAVAIPLFQVLLQADTNPEKLLQVRTIGYFRVTWEKKRGNQQLTQCYKVPT